MENYILRQLQETDYERVAEIYNSNALFLKSHLNISKISPDFIKKESENMQKEGFFSGVFCNTKSNAIVAACDFKIGKEVYLSLLIVDGNLKGNGIGKVLYHQLEQLFISHSAKSVRIDVVDDYEGNVIWFWERLGFVTIDEISLCWNDKISHAKIMKKVL